MPVREAITRVGLVLSKTLSPPNVPPVYSIRLQDSLGLLMVKWLGRREVPGVDLGAMLKVSGIPLQAAGGQVLINPDYQLLKGGQ